MRTLILSDLHLGSRSSRADAHLSALEQLCRQFDRVILNGDTLERFERAGAVEENDRLAAKAAGALASRNGPPEILCGNHDPAISTRNWIYLEASQSLVFHGDCILDWTHPTRKKDKHMAANFAAAWAKMGGRPKSFLEIVDTYRDIQREFLAANAEIFDSRSKAFYLFHALIPPTRPFLIVDYWRRAPGRVAQLAQTFDRPVRTVIVGHSHRSGEWQRHGLRVLNTGSFMPLSKPYGIIVDGAHVSIHPLSELLRARSFNAATPQRLT